MARPHGVFKRQPDLGEAHDIQRRFEAITKAQWAELYRDLFHAVMGDTYAGDFMADAEARLVMLKLNGLAGG